MPTENGQIARRKERMEMALKIIRKRNGVDWKRVLHEISFSLGVTEKKAWEYMEILEKVDGYSIEDEKIKVKEE